MQSTLLSTKLLSASQKNLILNAGLCIVSYDAISIASIPFTLPEKKIEQLVFTSQNGVRHFLHSITEREQAFYQAIPCYCVGSKTKSLLEEKGFKVLLNAINAESLGQEIPIGSKPLLIQGKKARTELSLSLKTRGILYELVEVYDTEINPKKFLRKFEGILFYSPSGVESFCLENNLDGQTAICIGSTTATAAREMGAKVVVASKSTVESVIVTALKHLTKQQEHSNP